MDWLWAGYGIDIWPLAIYRVAIGWLWARYLASHGLAIAMGYILAISWLLVGCQLTISWLFTGYLLAIGWLSTIYQLAISWL